MAGLRGGGGFVRARYPCSPVPVYSVSMQVMNHPNRLTSGISLFGPNDTYRGTSLIRKYPSRRTLQEPHT